MDVFKFWLMLKARGLTGFERLVDNAMDMCAYLADRITAKPGFRLITSDQFQYTNVCFWYIPKRMRDQPETDEWWTELYTIAPIIKEKMIMAGTLMVGYSPLPYQQKGNFLRMVLTCFPPANTGVVDFLLEETERLAADI